MSEHEFLEKIHSLKAKRNFKDWVFNFEIKIKKRHELSVGDRLKLFHATKNQEIYIYEWGLGRDYLGTVPSDYYYPITYNLNDESTRFINHTELPDYNHAATVKSVSKGKITVEIILYNIKLLRDALMLIDEYTTPLIKEKVRQLLNQKYKMQKPVMVKFKVMTNLINKLKSNLSLKVFQKDFYIENLGEYKIQLLNENLEVIAEATSSNQSQLLLRVIKAYYNGQSLVVESIENKHKDTSHLFVEEQKKESHGILSFLKYLWRPKEIKQESPHQEVSIYVTIGLK